MCSCTRLCRAKHGPIVYSRKQQRGRESKGSWRRGERKRCSATTAPTIAGWQALPTFGTGIHIMKWRQHFRGRVTRGTFAAATAPTFAAAAAFGARHWPSPASLLCFSFVLPAAALPQHMLLHSLNVEEWGQQQRHMQLVASVTCNMRSRAALTTCNSPSAAQRMHARRRFKWGEGAGSFARAERRCGCTHMASA